MRAPRVRTGVQQPPAATILRRDARPGLIAKATAVETIFIGVDLPLIRTDRQEVLDTHEPEALDTRDSEVGLVQQTERAGEAEIPAQTGAVSPVAEPGPRCAGTVPAINRGGGRKSPSREDLHTVPGFASPLPVPCAPRPASTPSRTGGASPQPLLPEALAASPAGAGSFLPAPERDSFAPSADATRSRARRWPCPSSWKVWRSRRPSIAKSGSGGQGRSEHCPRSAGAALRARATGIEEQRE